jgi:cobalamin-dependent methionine synthase I
MFPAQTATAGIDWRALGDRYAMSGGYIKKAAIRAAALAFARATTLTTDDLHAAARAEYAGIGRIA